MPGCLFLVQRVSDQQLFCSTTKDCFFTGWVKICKKSTEKNFFALEWFSSKKNHLQCRQKIIRAQFLPIISRDSKRVIMAIRIKFTSSIDERIETFVGIKSFKLLSLDWHVLIRFSRPILYRGSKDSHPGQMFFSHNYFIYSILLPAILFKAMRW